jgi:hypothetical protein
MVEPAARCPARKVNRRISPALGPWLSGKRRLKQTGTKWVINKKTSGGKILRFRGKEAKYFLGLQKAAMATGKKL